MKFTVRQIVISNEVADRVNRGERTDIWEAHMEASIKNNPNPGIENGYYTPVAIIEASDLEAVFRVGNIGPDREGESIERIGKMHSISVGDIVTNEHGTMYFCEPVGWRKLAYREVAQ